MGLIKAALGALGGNLADQWKEYYYCEAMDAGTIMVKGQKRVSSRSANKHGSDNIITKGSVVAVANGQCMIIVEQGKVVEMCAEPGEFVFDNSTEPSIFMGDLKESIGETFKNIGKRFTFGGEPPKDQRVYYINTKEMLGNKYGTPSPVPFRVVDQRAGIDIDIAIKCFGEYSYHIADPIKFYTNVCGNVEDVYLRDNLDSQLKTEVLTALQPAFSRISEMGIRYSALPGHAKELADAMNAELSADWGGLRGIEIVRFGVSSVKATEEDEAMIKEMQKNAAFVDPSRAAANMAGAQMEAMKSAAKNEGAGAAMAFMGMNMAGGAAGGAVQGLYEMAQNQGGPQQPQGQPTKAGGGPGGTASGTGSGSGDVWRCPACGAEVSGKFCTECGAKRPVAEGWTCSCGAVNKGRFCSECGAKKPAGEPLYKCDKCGWEPEDPKHPPKFCPECGDPFGEEDIIKQ